MSLRRSDLIGVSGATSATNTQNGSGSTWRRYSASVTASVPGHFNGTRYHTRMKEPVGRLDADTHRAPQDGT